jgi:type IV pilus assembly protein PilE
MKSRGFSLIELMIVVAILGIIAAIALPNYSSYVVRSKRTECRAGLMQVMQQQERYFTQQNTYLPFTSVAASIPMKQFSGDSAASSACLISAAACSVPTGSTIASCIQLVGVPNTYTDPAVANIRLQSDGTKDCSGTDQSHCWK